MKTISIVSPCYNEEDNVQECYQAVKALFDGPLQGYHREHIFLDNASDDRTVEILKQIAAQDPAVKLVVNSRDFGVFRSTFNGLKYATGEATVVMLPVDLQDPPELIPEFVALWEQGYEVIAGARSNREEGGPMRLARKAFYRLVNRLSDFEISPDVGEFQLLDRKVMEALLLHRDQYPYIRGMISSLGFRRIVVDYVWKERKRGKTKHDMFMLMDQALNGIFAFSRAPLRMCTIAGLAISVASIAFSVFSVLFYLFSPDSAPRGVTTIITALFFLSGIQMLFIGILGEYVTSIHNQVRGGPIVIERERVNIDPVGDDKPAPQRARRSKPKSGPKAAK
jgi:glycosyltransferase involved in cell wall biosynthesis